MITEQSSIAGASNPSTAESVRVWPYQSGMYGRDALYRVWKLMEDDGATKQAFWDEALDEDGADLASFARTFDNSPSKRLLMIERIDTGLLCGAFWVMQIQPGHQAFVGMWMHTDSRGPLSVEAAHKSLRLTFEAWSLVQVWAMTPWKSAGALCRKMGFKKEATFHKFCQFESGSFLPVSLYRLEREAFNGISH